MIEVVQPVGQPRDRCFTFEPETGRLNGPCATEDCPIRFSFDVAAYLLQLRQDGYLWFGLTHTGHVADKRRPTETRTKIGNSVGVLLSPYARNAMMAARPLV